MRIISGEHKGRNLKTLEGMNTRPTSDRAKVAIFNILAYEIPETDVLDLFAGSGALGLECISRGSRRCVFVDNSKEAINIIRDNVKLCKSEDKSEIRNCDYKTSIQKSLENEEKFDLIFMDPPYSKDMEYEALKLIAGILSEDGIIIIETDEKNNLPDEVENIIMYDKRKYGRAVISFWHRKQEKV